MLDSELAPFNPVPEPEEPYIHAFRTLRVDGICGEALRDCVVYHDRSW